MCASAEQVLTRIEPSQLPDETTIVRLMNDNELSDARIRITVTAGSIRRDPRSPEETLTICATASPLAAYPSELYNAGVTVLVSRFRQSPYDPLTGHKTTSYLGRLIALAEAQKAQCHEGLWFTPDNLLAEGSISNVFIVDSGVVATPPLDTPVLPGIARATVLEICRDGGIEFEERPITIHHLLDADEVFLTNAMMQVMPVARVEKREIGGGKPGPIAKRLLQRYRELVAKECRVRGE